MQHDKKLEPSFKPNDKILYPEIVVDSPICCDCKIKDYNENPGLVLIGPYYCPKHNVINLEVILYVADSAKIIEDEVVSILNHETIHWILCKDFNEEISMKFDSISPAILDLI